MPPVFRVLKWLPTLQTWGFGLQYFPKYVNLRLRPHAVDVVLLSFIKSGAGRHVMGDEVFEEKGASIGITHYGQVHDILTGREGMEIFNIYLDLKRHALPPLPQEFTRTIPLLFPLHPAMGNRLNRRVRIPIADPGPLAALLHRWLAEQERPARPGSELVMRACLQVFLIECCRNAAAAGYQTASAAQEGAVWLERVRRVLDEQFAERHPLPKLAAIARVSPAHLSREFRRYAGKPLVTYLNQRRVEAAMLRLRTSDEKILGIALDCGFADLSRFNRVFRQLAGVTPSAYRKSFRGAP